MNVATFLRERAERAAAAWQPRDRCEPCKRPRSECFCEVYRPFASDTQIALLVHPYEARRGIATARLTKRCLTNSLWYQAFRFDDHKGLQQLLDDDTVSPVLLYPGRGAVDLTTCTNEERRAVFTPGKRPVVLVLDGTWAQAKRMRRLSTQLNNLPMICFTPPTPSRFRVRQQPKVNCYSTIEAVHHLIDLFLPPGAARPHDNLLEVFDAMVEKQLRHQERGEGRPSRKIAHLYRQNATL